jgi:hypothetical protein
MDLLLGVLVHEERLDETILKDIFLATFWLVQVSRAGLPGPARRAALESFW